MIGDLFNVFNGIVNAGDYESRKVALLKPKDNKGIGVSTVYTIDMGFETALLDLNGVHPVERYPSKEEAEAGHQKWVDTTKAGIKTVTKLGYGSLVDSREITLEPITIN